MIALMTDPMTFTESAAAKTWELIQEEGNYELKLRVYVTGGGCSGFQYGFTFDEAVSDDDTVITRTLDADKVAVQLLVDPMSFQYLVGAEIDYKEDIEGAQFIIRNPNAKTTCGCGSSFSADVAGNDVADNDDADNME
jgi:iron-sulfur cluster insertion protein